MTANWTIDGVRDALAAKQISARELGKIAGSAPVILAIDCCSARGSRLTAVKPICVLSSIASGLRPASRAPVKAHAVCSAVCSIVEPWAQPGQPMLPLAPGDASERGSSVPWGQALRNARRSALITSWCVVAMPCGKPW